MKAIKRKRAKVSSAQDNPNQLRVGLHVFLPSVMVAELRERARQEGRLLYAVVEAVIAKGLGAK